MVVNCCYGYRIAAAASMVARALYLLTLHILIFGVHTYHKIYYVTQCPPTNRQTHGDTFSSIRLSVTIVARAAAGVCRDEA